MRCWFGYGDPTMEEALYWIEPLRQFVQLSLLDVMPDEKPCSASGTY
ncbi:hypothetical protein [Dyella japonica]|uniref:Transposase InsH N-terminal domain-containing protein n=1 Tax=Dyella japonica TaxID=231455 RepID=A0ABV2K412_9GAMM